MRRTIGFVLMCLIWGVTWLPMKLASQVVPPIYLASVRFIVAGLLLGIAALALRLPLRPSRPGRVVGATLLISTLAFGFLFWGTARAPTGLAAIVNLSLIPLFLMLLAAAHGQESLTGRRLAAIGCGIGGLVFLFATRESGPTGTGSPLPGLLAVAIGTFCYAWGSVVSRPLVDEMHPISLAGWQTLLGGLTLLPVSLALEGFRTEQITELAEPRVMVGLGVLVFGGSLTAFSIYLWLVRDWGAFRAGLYAFVSPIVAVTLGVVWAGEPFGWTEGLGMALMLAATALAIRRPVRASEATGSSLARPA